MGDVEMNQLVPGTTICWSCQNKFAMPPGATMAACPFCQSTNQIMGPRSPSLPIGQPVAFPQQQMMVPQMMVPQMMPQQMGGQVSVVMVNQQPGQQPVRQYIQKPSARNLCATLSFLYIAMAWIVIGITTPGWRKVVYYTDRNPNDGTVRQQIDYSYKISVGIGFYEYVESQPKWLAAQEAPPVVGSGNPGENIPLLTNCSNKNYTWLGSTECSTYNTLQGLSIPTLVLSVLLPLLVHYAMMENYPSFGKTSTLILGTALTGLMIAMFVVSEQCNWGSLNSDPRLGSMDLNGYGFGFGFFCVGFIFLLVADSVFLCTTACSNN